MRKTLRYSFIYLFTIFCNAVFAEDPGTVPATAFTVAQALEKINALDDAQQSEDMFWVTGVVASINELSTKYGNATFYIKDANGTEQLYIYRAKGFGNENITTEDFIKEGDVVYIRGYFKKYVKDNTVTPEIVNGYIHSVNGKSKEDIVGGDTSVMSVAEALTFTKALDADVESADEIQVKGKICSIKFEYSAQYGTATYNISDDGQTGEGKEFTVYGSYYFDNKKWEEGKMQIAVGDEVIVKGKVIYFKGTTPEFANKKNYLVSLNGKTKDEGGNDNPNSQVKTIKVAEALEIINALADGKTTSEEYIVKGIVSAVDEISVDYGNATFDIVDNANDQSALKVFRAKDAEGQKITNAELVKVGDEVVVQGKLQKYVKNDVTTPEVAQNGKILTVNGHSTGIKNVNVEESDAPVFNLAGQRVE